MSRWELFGSCPERGFFDELCVNVLFTDSQHQKSEVLTYQISLLFYVCVGTFFVGSVDRSGRSRTVPTTT